MVSEGYQIQQVNINFSGDPEHQHDNIKRMHEDRKMTISIFTLRDWSMLSIAFDNFFQDLFDKQVYETRIQSARICVVWKKKIPEGETTQFTDCVIQSSSDIVQISNELIDINWIREI